MSADERLTTLWETIKERLKAAEINQPLYRALDAAVLITLDGTSLVVGFTPQTEPDMHFLNAPQNQPLIERVLRSVATRPLKLVTIDGTTQADYQHYLARQQAAGELRQRGHATAEPAAHAHTPPGATAHPTAPYQPVADWIGDAANGAAVVTHFAREMHQRLRALEHHGQVQCRAEAFLACMPEVEVAERAMLRIEHDPVQQVRQFHRLLEAWGEVFGVPGILAALEYEHYKRGRR
ncbi:MAG: hypothetical protein HYU66_18310 [Armatimonadetes bacterium]|nr:hypothetical protein [Armatimonadota bacterium]